MMTASFHAFGEHTADVRLHVEAPDLAGLLVEAGGALGELMGGDALPAADGPWVPARVAAADRDALLVGWIDELVSLSEIHKRVWTRFRIDRIDDRAVEGAVRGPAVEDLRTPVKAATFHGLHVVDDDGALRATVVLDV